MKRVIRQNVFETNSSSSHSIVIKKDDGYFTKEELSEYFILDNNKIDIGYDFYLSFGRYPFNILYTPYDKMRYLLASYSNDTEKRNEINELMKSLIDNCEGIQFPKKYDYNDNENDDNNDNNDDNTYYGDIDHQSSTILNSFIKKNNISFKDFLLQKKYVIIIDSDEYNEWNKLKKSGLIKTDNIVKEIGYFEYEDEY